MKRFFIYLSLLSVAVTLSAWLGTIDGRSQRASMDRQLNTSTKRQGLNEGEVLIWAPGQGEPPVKVPRTVQARPAPQPTKAATVHAPPATAGGGDPLQTTRRLLPLARPLGAPRRGDWRNQIDEPDQDCNQFLREIRTPQGALAVLPVGELSPEENKAIGHVVEAMSAFFGRPVVCATPLPLTGLPASLFRKAGGRKQINAEAFMDRILRPAVGGNVASVVAITASDLYPGGKWQFETAFGWSSFTDGTSIISTYQIVVGKQASSGKNLLRLSKLAVHELCHTFGLKHCSEYLCLLNGSGNLRENDSKPFALCPDCLAKLSIATGQSPGTHLREMLELCKAKGFNQEARYYARALEELK